MGISGNVLIVDDEATLRHTLTAGPFGRCANIKATAVASGQEKLLFRSKALISSISIFECRT